MLKGASVQAGRRLAEGRWSLLRSCTPQRLLGARAASGVAGSPAQRRLQRPLHQKHGQRLIRAYTPGTFWRGMVTRAESYKDELLAHILHDVAAIDSYANLYTATCVGGFES